MWGLRWDINPAQMALGNLLKPIRSTGGTSNYLRLGPRNIITVPVGPINALLSIINTFINFDILVGQDSRGQWAGYIRLGFGVGNELSVVGIMDTVEDYFSMVIPAVNVVPTPVVWGDLTVPANAWGIYASSSAFGPTFTPVFSGAPTAGSISIAAITEGYGIFRLPTVNIDARGSSTQAA